jgi:methylenetetrahydrofolate--tRNA-(uracil-5-)-methyltransferase
LLTGIETARELKGLTPLDFPKETAIGALSLYTSGGSVSNFQPMNVNFGIMEPLHERVKGKREKNLALSRRSLGIIDRIYTSGQRAGIRGDAL